MLSPSSTHMTNPWRVHMARIVAIHNEIADVLSYELEIVDRQVADGYHFRPGQFNMLYVPGCGEVAISLSGSPRGSSIYHTIRSVGRVTEAMANMSRGDQIGLRGPYGSAWPIAACDGHDVVLLAGGIGLAPLRPAIYELLGERDRIGRMVLLMGARSPELMLYADEFDRWRRQGLEVLTTVDRSDGNWSGHVGVVPGLLNEVTALRPEHTIVMTCGPEVMMHYAAIGALQLGIPPQNIWVSLERNMQCAVGFCGHCQLGPLFVCKDGPVLPYQRAEPLLRVREW